MTTNDPGPPAVEGNVGEAQRAKVHAPPPRGVCPTCGQLGKRVGGQTLNALLAVSLRATTLADYQFCRTARCPVVYFAVDGTPTFTIDQVRERVYQKEPDAPDVLICYCFQHTVGAVQTAPDPATIVADITLGIQAGQCACDLRNPQGSCCLSNVHALSKRLVDQRT